MILAGGLPGLLPVQAATNQFWNPGGSGGDGNWSTGPADTNWNVTPGALDNTTWTESPDNIAVFQDAVGGTVTVFGSPDVAKIVQNGSDYQLVGGSLDLVPDSGGAAPVIDVQSGNLSIASTLGGFGFVKSGAGTLSLSGVNNFGPWPAVVEVTGGTLALAAADQLADTGALTLSGGGTVVLDAGNERVSALVSTGGTIAGSGVLRAHTYQLGDGTTLSGNLGIGVLSTTGAVLISGTAASETVNAGAGTLTLTGGNLWDFATLTLSAGAALQMQGDETIDTLVSNGGTIDGPGVLTAYSYRLNHGSSVTGELGNGEITTNGLVSISGTTGSGPLIIASGVLSLSGQSAATEVLVGGGVLSLTGNNLSDLAEVSVYRGLQVGAAETIGTLYVNGGNVSGPGLLTASSTFLTNGGTIAGSLSTGTLESFGNATVSGSAIADTIGIYQGVLTNTGTLGHAGSEIHLGGGHLIANGVQNYAVLTTSSVGIGFWQGNLTNAAMIRPGDSGITGTLGVIGNFANAADGTLSFDIGPGIDGHDFMTVTGSATFGGTLELHKLGADEIAAFVPLQIIDAASYSGNFDSLQEDLAGTVLFNPLNGSITRLGGAGEADLFGRATTNQASTFAALYDDVIDPGTGNVAYRPGLVPPFALTSGIASTEDPDLLWALSASITPQGLNAALLNRLSPETYAGLGDYSGQATRTHRRTAFQAPALSSGSAAPPASRGAKDAKAVIAPPPALGWEVFAAADYFDGETTGSLGGADYDLNGAGVVAGVRVSPLQRLRVAAFLAGDDGEVRGGLIDADARGVAAGLIGEWIIEESHALRLSGGITYGSHRFEGTRGTASATGAGWSPAFASFSDVDADSLDLFLGLDAVAWKNERIRIIPGIGLEYRGTSTDGFREFASAAPGGPITLAVDGSSRDSLVTNLSLAAQADITRAFMLDGQLGLDLDLNDDDPERISARFTGGSRSMAALTTPLSDELFYLATGATWTATGSVRVRLGYRIEFRSDADPLSEVSLGTAFRF